MCACPCSSFFFNDTATTEIYTLSLHDALPIWDVLLTSHLLLDSKISPDEGQGRGRPREGRSGNEEGRAGRSEEHTSELQSLTNLVCRLLLEKKKNKPS